MPHAITLSEVALLQFRLHLQGDFIRVDDANREAYRELARAGLMIPMSGYASGPESHYRLTKEGSDRRSELLNDPGLHP